MLDIVAGSSPEPAAEHISAADIETKEERPIEKQRRATGGRARLKDGTITAGSKFITEICKHTWEDT